MLLKEWREQAELDRAEAGRRVGVTAEAIRLYETGDRIPQREVMQRFFDVSGGLVTPNDFYSIGVVAPTPVPAPTGI